jgi:hypothetical protein
MGNDNKSLVEKAIVGPLMKKLDGRQSLAHPTTDYLPVVV